MILSNQQKMWALEYSLTDSKSVCEDSETLGISDDEYREAREAVSTFFAEVLNEYRDKLGLSEEAG